MFLCLSVSLVWIRGTGVGHREPRARRPCAPGRSSEPLVLWVRQSVACHWRLSPPHSGVGPHSSLSSVVFLWHVQQPRTPSPDEAGRRPQRAVGCWCGAPPRPPLARLASRPRSRLAHGLVGLAGLNPPLSLSPSRRSPASQRPIRLSIRLSIRRPTTPRVLIRAPVWPQGRAWGRARGWAPTCARCAANATRTPCP